MSCPICQKAADAKYRPFCSKRCADIDLGKWLNSEYSIPDANVDGLEEALEASQEKEDRLH